jgi:uridine kinase
LAGDENVSLIKLDSYYVARTHQALEQRALSNYDHPDAFDWRHPVAEGKGLQALESGWGLAGDVLAEHHQHRRIAESGGGGGDRGGRRHVRHQNASEQHRH